MWSVLPIDPIDPPIGTPKRNPPLTSVVGGFCLQEIIFARIRREEADHPTITITVIRFRLVQLAGSEMF
jgi:hypothetical protein